MANSVVFQQPSGLQQPVANAEPVETGWNSDICNCCDDMNSCCYGFWCCPCLACETTSKFGQYHCLPLLDLCSPAIITVPACGIPLFVPPAVLSVRVAIRHKYRIKGSLCNDVATSCFCMWCSWCQMARELKQRKKSPTINNVQQTPNITVIQNAPTTSNVHMSSQESYAMSASQPLPVSAPGYASQPPSYPGYVSQHDSKPSMIDKY